MKKLLLISFCYLIMDVQAQMTYPSMNTIRVSDNFANPALWTANNLGANGTMTVSNAPNGVSFNSSGCGWGNGQFCAKNIPNFTGGGGITPIQVPNLNWTMDFDYNPTSYGTFATAHLLMGLTNNGLIHPVQTSTLGGNFSTTSSDVIAVMLCSTPGNTSASQVGIWAKNGNQGGNNIVYASSGSTSGSTQAGVNTNTITTSAVGFNGASNAPGITNGIGVPLGATYHIRLNRAGEVITLTVTSNNLLLGTVRIVVPVAGLNISPAAGARFTASNFPQGHTSRMLSATVNNLTLAWEVSPFLTFTTTGGLTAGLNLFNANGNNIGFSYCLSQFNPSSQVKISSSNFIGATYSWTLNTCGTSQYVVLAPTTIQFSGIPNPNFACVTNPQWDYPCHVNITNLSGNAAGNVFDVLGGVILRVASNCRVANPNALMTINNTSLLISPNPATSSLKVQIPDDIDMSKLSVLNFNGQTMIQETLDSKVKDIELDIRNLPSGMYLLKVEGNNNPLIQKFIKE